MGDRRIHEVITTDGATIRATVHGGGPQLVFLQGLIGDGHLDWQALLAHLTDRFTCHLPSWRGRGLSDDHPDLSLGRLISDAVTYVESIAEPTGVVGWSAGAMHALLVAAESDSVQALAPFEPVTPRLMDEPDRAALAAAVARTGELAAEGRLSDAVRAFAGFVMSEEEIATIEDLAYFPDAAKYVPHMLKVFQQAMAHQAPTIEDPTVLAAISVPVRVLVGSHTKGYAMGAAQHVTDHVPGARLHAIPDAGHAAPLTHPEALAHAISEFFTSTLPPA